MVNVLIIGGPTASGKSALATQLAQEKGGAILNGDSLQVYAGLEIVTDQPVYQIQRNIPHRLYGFLDPTQPYSVGMWLTHVLSAIEECHHLGLLPIVVGGTGFYLKALQEGITPIPFVEPHVRQDLEEQNKPQDTLYQELQRVDAYLAERIHPHDHQRTLRGLEVFYGTGKPLSFWQAQKPQALPYTFETLLCMPSKDDHRAKIVQRIEAMLERDVLEEISAVLPLSLSATAQKAIGLREFGSYLSGDCSLKQAKELTFFHTCQYAKRQRTWFRHQFG